MSGLTKDWLSPFDWEFVTEVNRNLCARKNALHKPTSDGHASAKQLWEQGRAKKLKFTEALDICRSCHRLAPFCFYKGNTFASIARDLIDDLPSRLAADQAHILRSLVGHIVAGTATDIEIKQLDELLEQFEK